MDDEAPQMNPRKIRQGLGLVTAVVLVAIVLIFVVDDPLGRAVMFAVAVSAIVRAYLLTRGLRRDAGGR